MAHRFPRENPAWTSASRVCFLTNRNISARSVAREIDRYACYFEESGEERGNSVTKEEGNSICKRTLHTVETSFPLPRCKNMKTNKIWKRKGKKERRNNDIFFLFFEILRTETLLTFKPLCTLQHVVKLYTWIYIIEQLAKMRQLKEPVKKFRQFSLPTIQKKLRPTFKLFEFRFKFPLTKVSKQFSSSFRGN